MVQLTLHKPGLFVKKVHCTQFYRGNMQQVLFSLSPPAQRLQEIESALIKASLYQKENILLIQNILHLNDVITYSGHLPIKRKINRMAAS